MKPNFLVVLIDDLRHDEFGAGGHPYMRTPNIDRLAQEGALFERAFHTTPICSPNRASIVTGQYASRHGIIDNVARDAMSHRLPNYHLELQKLGYETAHIGKWHMGNDGMPRPGYDTWVSYDGHGRIVNPKLNHDGRYVEHEGYITDIMNESRSASSSASARSPSRSSSRTRQSIRTPSRPQTAHSVFPRSADNRRPPASRALS